MRPKDHRDVKSSHGQRDPYSVVFWGVAKNQAKNLCKCCCWVEKWSPPKTAIGLCQIHVSWRLSSLATCYLVWKTSLRVAHRFVHRWHPNRICPEAVQQPFPRSDSLVIVGRYSEQSQTRRSPRLHHLGRTTCLGPDKGHH